MESRREKESIKSVSTLAFLFGLAAVQFWNEIILSVLSREFGELERIDRDHAFPTDTSSRRESLPKIIVFSRSNIKAR